ncbi:hypothetical protein ACH0B5_15665 [Ureibacillus sp. 179-F W5.1 NHS]|uniref:Uncharacterized protein n=1 Tax=Lysinibacillus halotolerans TaxID=1368476 RepID=A0A3M8H2U7_9BACI|nr:hypothetical protein [Lysinibacillus halotolerans]RNC96250.1 hypothetical protein EC501_17175 [Lysinibacillus halotolerans]
MKITIFLLFIYILSFIILFLFLNKENKKEESKDSIPMVIYSSILFAFIITIAIAFFLFLLIGSTSVIDTLFSLNIATNQLIVIGISFLVYWLTLDSIFEKVFEFFMGETLYTAFSLAITRVAAFYIIGVLMRLDEHIDLTISIGVSVILLIIDGLFIIKGDKS